jgi:hypothetical protein
MSNMVSALSVRFGLTCILFVLLKLRLGEWESENLDQSSHEENTEAQSSQSFPL